MRLENRYPVLWSLFKNFRKSQARTMVLMVTALIEVGCMRTMMLGQYLASELGELPESAMNRIYRLLRNPRVETQDLTRALLGALSQKAGEVLVAVDWTEWVNDLRVLVGAVVAGNRAIPIQASTHHRETFLRSQNAFENTFFAMLKGTVADLGISVTILADRGFRRASLVRLLSTMELGFVIRLMSDVSVHTRKGWRLLKNYHLGTGQAVDLGEVLLGFDRASQVPVRVVGVRAPGAKEIWWLATNNPHSVSHIVAMYDRRMATEEQFRDTKGYRFGLDLAWTHFGVPEHIDRLFLLVGAAVLVMTATGHMVTRASPKVRVPHPTKGPRQSYLSVGLVWTRKLRKSLRLGIRRVLDHVPRPDFRHFPWIPKGLVHWEAVPCVAN